MTSSTTIEAQQALQALMSACRFKVVVERCRKQVKAPKGEKKRSTWVDTNDFVFSLFDGAMVLLPPDEAKALVQELNRAIARVLEPFRSPALRSSQRAVSGSLSLLAAKPLQASLAIIHDIDNVQYVLQPRSDRATAVVPVVGSPSPRLSGDELVMGRLLVDANNALDELLRPHVLAARERLRSLVTAIV